MTMHLEFEQSLNERVDGCLGDGIAHGDIDVLYLRRDRVQDGNQEVLVRKDYRMVFILYQGRDKLCLGSGRGDADNLDLRNGKTFGVKSETLAEFFDVPRHEEGRIVPWILYHPAGIIPAESCQAGISHLPHDSLLAFVEGIETHENIFLDIP